MSTMTNFFTKMIGGSLLLAASMLLPFSHGYYMPGVQPQTFLPNAEVIMKVNSMTSIHTQLPKDYYRLPFCKPPGGPKMASENLGEFLTGNKVQSSPYIINMLREVFCNVLCQVELDNKASRYLRMHIKYGYHNNWIIDNLPSASVGLTGTGMKQRHYAGGFPIGFIDRETKDAYVYNHVNINIEYHQVDNEREGYRVVGFAVEPISIKHKYANNYLWNGQDNEGFSKPLDTCPGPGIHLGRGDVQVAQVVNEGERILYTYDVLWQRSETRWASRWDVYLTEDGNVPAQVHWYSITNSILVVLFLSLLVINILYRNLRRDIAGYNSADLLTDEEKEEEADESGWKLIHADVFRPPSSFPMLYCVFIGSGLQIAVTIFASICLSAVGFISPARRGSLMTTVLVFYMLCGIFAGYASSRMYKCFRGRNWQLCTLVTAILFPGVAFILFLFFNTVLAFFHSVGSAPFLDIVILAAMWCCVSIPLVFVGAYFGYRAEVMEFPTVTSTIARVIPEPSSPILNPKLSMLCAGIIPFAAAYVELFFILTSLWMDQYYYVFGFTLVVYMILLITCSEVTLLLSYYQLCAENHRWWWYSFMCAGSTALYIFLYSCVWFGQLEASKMIITYLLYFGYMALICFGLFLVTGMVGTMSCFFFVRKIFSTIKVD